MRLLNKREREKHGGTERERQKQRYLSNVEVDKYKRE